MTTPTRRLLIAAIVALALLGGVAIASADAVDGDAYAWAHGDGDHHADHADHHANHADHDDCHADHADHHADHDHAEHHADHDHAEHHAEHAEHHADHHQGGGHC